MHCEYQCWLLVAAITRDTDHKNLTYLLSQYLTQCIMPWCLFIEDYVPKFEYLQGKDNLKLDALSQVPQDLSWLGESDSTDTEDAYLVSYIDMFSTFAEVDCYLFTAQFNHDGQYPLHGATILAY
jgi:hypothetical protein